MSKQPTPERMYYKGLVRDIDEGHKGDFAFAIVSGFGVVTFSLNRDVWMDERFPEGGNEVLLSDITAKRSKGKTVLRANIARFFRPELAHLIQRPTAQMLESLHTVTKSSRNQREY